MNVDKNARLTPAGRALLADRVAGGWTVKAAAGAAGVSRRTAHKWLTRHRLGGERMHRDRSAAPRRCPRRVSATRVSEIDALRRDRLIGPNVTGAQGWDQDLLDIGQEPVPGPGAVQDHGCGHARQPQGPNEGGGLPVPMAHAGAKPFAPWRAAMPAVHLGAGSGLVDEHQGGGIEIELAFEPGFAPRQVVETGLHVRVRRRFLSII